MLQACFSAFISIIVFFSGIFGGAANTAQPLDGGTRVSYGDAWDQVYDIYIPENASGDVDVVLMVHGGAWMMGDQTEFSDYCVSAANDYGYVAVTMDYRRLTDGAVCADMVDDIYSTVSNVKQLLADRGLTADKMAIAGHSAGAQISLLYAINHKDDSPIDIAFVVNNSAPSYFFDPDGSGTTTMERFSYLVVSALSGTAVPCWDIGSYTEVIASINPYDLVTADFPPVINVHGAKDTMVPYTNTVNLNNKLVSLGVDSMFITYENSDHFLKEDAQSMSSIRAQAFFEYAERYF